MPRPPKERRVEFIPKIKYFKPAAVPMRDLEEVILTIEEVEAIRLKDLEGLLQEECAERMKISRATFQRILLDARSKIADALVMGKAIRFGGGDYYLGFGRWRCHQCDQVFHQKPHHEGKLSRHCPECGTELEKI